jgi:hypothetical protein
MQVILQDFMEATMEMYLFVQNRLLWKNDWSQHWKSVEECCILCYFVIALVVGRSQVISLGGSYSDSCKHGENDFINGEVDGLTKYQL